MQYKQKSFGFGNRTFEDDVRAFNWFNEDQKPIIYRKKQKPQEMTYPEAIGLDPYDWYNESKRGFF